MATIYVRDVSEDTARVMKLRAARAGQSLQAYLRHLLDQEASALTPEEAAEQAREIAARANVTAAAVRAVVEAARERP